MVKKSLSRMSYKQFLQIVFFSFIFFLNSLSNWVFVFFYKVFHSNMFPSFRILLVIITRLKPTSFFPLFVFCFLFSESCSLFFSDNRYFIKICIHARDPSRKSSLILIKSKSLLTTCLLASCMSRKVNTNLQIRFIDRRRSEYFIT